MTTRETSEIRELTAAELDQVTGGAGSKKGVRAQAQAFENLVGDNQVTAEEYSSLHKM
jgi:hypothetical protein